LPQQTRAKLRPAAAPPEELRLIINRKGGIGTCMARPTPLSRDEFGLFRPLQTRWADNDIYGHMNNVVHYALFDTAINGWLIEEGLLDPLEGGIVGLVVETGCSYFAEIAFPDRVTAGIRVGHLGTSSVRYEIALYRNDDEGAAAQGHFVHVYVDRATRKPKALPANWRQRLEEFVR
jgi:acyl-CoA thioester hydrolase